MDDSDMLATPLSKLPPPVMQSRMDDPMGAGGGGGGSAPNYQELIKDFDRAPGRGAEYDARPPSHSPPPSQHRMMEDMYEPMAQHQNQMQQQPQMMQYQNQYQPTTQPNPLVYSMPAPTYTSPPPLPLQPPTKKSLLTLETLKNTRAWFAAIVIFVFVLYGLPKIKATIPALVSPLTGDLSVPGVAAASAIAGLFVATISEHFLT